MNLLLVTDEQFAPATAVVLKSIAAFNNTKETTVFILHQGLSVETQNKIKIAGNSFRELVFVEASTEKFSRLGLPKLGGNYNTYFRLLAADVLPKEVDKVIYLDSDILVLGDLSRLWNEDVGDCFVLAVSDALSEDLSQHRNRILKELNRSETQYKATYFNNGVLVMNLAKWRQEGLFKQIANLCIANPQLFKYWDQDLLNVIIAEKWGELAQEWNVQSADFFSNKASSFHPESKEHKKLLSKPGIVHFTFGDQKPWLGSCRNPYRKVFLHFLKQTPFEGVEKNESFSWVKRLNALKNAFKDIIKRRVWKSADFEKYLRLNYFKD